MSDRFNNRDAYERTDNETRHAHACALDNAQNHARALCDLVQTRALGNVQTRARVSSLEQTTTCVNVQTHFFDRLSGLVQISAHVRSIVNA